MIEAVVIEWDESTQSGLAKSADGRTYQLRYQDGQSFYTSDDKPIPLFNGKHEQPTGYQLKKPTTGDPVLVNSPSGAEKHGKWGYMRHYIDLVERKYGTQFTSAN